MSKERWSDSSDETFGSWPMMSEIEWSDWWHDFIAKPILTRPSPGSSSRPITPTLTGFPTPPATGSRSAGEDHPVAISINVLVAESRSDADRVKSRFPQFRLHVAVTPKTDPLSCGRFVVGEYVWTPRAAALPASVRLRLRGKLSPLICPESVEEEFPDTLSSR
jgi:hypothetical protein